ncbi:MAG: hypothetical protein AAF696_07445 [Bacteroidota bacterium]
MAISPEWDQKVQKYLNKKLSSPEQLIFEKEVEQNAELEAYLKEQAQVRIAVGILGIEKLKKELNELGKQLGEKVPSEPEKAFSFGKAWYLGLAIAAAIVILLYFFLPSVPESPTPQELFAEYLSIEDESPSLARTPNSVTPQQVDSLIRLADNAFRTQSYKEAIPLYEAVLRKDPNNAKSHFFLGLSYSFEEQWEKSNSALRNVGSTSNFYDRSQMYIIKNALDRSDINEAKKLLQEISEDLNNAYQNQAQNLLLDLNQISSED